MVTDALSRRYTLFSVLEAKLVGFLAVQELHNKDPNFQEFVQVEIKSSMFTL